MNILKRIFLPMVLFSIIIGLGQTVFAAKTLRVGSGALNNTGTTDASREVLLDVMLEGGFNDVNGVVFTLTYDKDVFDFVSLVQNDKPIDNGDTYDPQNPPSAEIIGQTIYYQANNKADKGVVLIAAAAANFFNTTTDTYVPFKAKFRVKKGAGTGTYDIRAQKTVIGPDTAKNAGYDEPTPIPVATGLAPDASTAQNYLVDLVKGQIIVSGGYNVKGAVIYEGDPGENADGAVAKLYKSINGDDFVVDSKVVKNGEFSFTGVASGDYKVKVFATRPGFSKRGEIGFAVENANKTLAAITLGKYTAVKGKITLKGGVTIPGMTVLIKDSNGNEIGRVAADQNGEYVTFPIPANNAYTFWAVYGNLAPVQILNQNLEWDLALGSVSGLIQGLSDGQTVEVSISSETTKLKAYAQATGNAANEDQPYTINYLLPASDYVAAVVGQGVPPTFYKNVSSLDLATPVIVAADQDTSLDPFVFNPDNIKEISGNVEIGGVNTQGVTVYASNRNFANYKIYSALTGPDGHFTIQVDKDSYYVYLEYQGAKYYFKTAGETVRSLKDAVKVDVSENDQTDIDFVVVAADSSVDGVLTLKREDGLKMANVLVEARNKATGSANVTRTNGEGYYLIGNLNPGDHAVTVYPPNPYAPISEDVSLESGKKSTKNFVVNRNFTLTGTVTESVGNTPVQMAWVTLFNEDGSLLRPSVKTNLNGKYTLADIPDGIYKLSVYHKDYTDWETEVTVGSDLTLDVVLSAGALVNGKVTYDSAPVDGVNIRIVPPGSVYSLSTKTVDGGLYQFKGLLPNTSHLIGAKKGTEYTGYSDEVTTGDLGETTTKNIYLEKPVTTWSFAGTVMEGVTKVAGAYVLLDSSTTKYGKATRTGSDGRFAFVNVPQGDDYTLTVLPAITKPLIIESGIDIASDITDHIVSVPTLATLQGEITLLDGAAGKHIFVSVVNTTDTAAPMQVVKALDLGAGRYSYTVTVKSGDLFKIGAQDLEGNYAIKYYANGGSTDFANATAVEGSETPRDISL